MLVDAHHDCSYAFRETTVSGNNGSSGKPGRHGISSNLNSSNLVEIQEMVLVVPPEVSRLPNRPREVLHLLVPLSSHTTKRLTSSMVLCVLLFVFDPWNISH